MIKRKISSLIFLCFVLFLISFQYIPVVKGLTESYTDPQNDIFKLERATGNVEIVSSHDEIDIVNITLDGQYTNVTFAGNITGHDIECSIYFFENYNPDNIIFEYAVHYSNFTGMGFNVIFIKFIPSGDKYEYQFWNNTIGWTSSNISADIIGTSSDYVIEATIPDNSSLSIHDNITWYVFSSFFTESFVYIDCAPNSYCAIQETGLPITEIILFIAIVAFCGIGAVYLYKKRKPKQTSFL